MGELYPTPTRLALLRDVQARRIVRVTPVVQRGCDTAEYYVQDGDLRRVTARIDEMEQTGWVALDPCHLEEVLGGALQHYRLTAAGEKVLADG